MPNEIQSTKSTQEFACKIHPESKGNRMLLSSMPCPLPLLSIENSKKEYIRKFSDERQGVIYSFLVEGVCENVFLLLRWLPTKNDTILFVRTSYFQEFFYSDLHQVCP